MLPNPELCITKLQYRKYIHWNTLNKYTNAQLTIKPDENPPC